MKKVKVNPGKIVKKSVKTITQIPQSLYSTVKSASKKKAEITFIGKKKTEKTKIQLYEYDENHLSIDDNFVDLDALKEPKKDKVYWLNYHGIYEVKLFEELASVLTLDRITIRHVVDTTQRPKVEEYPKYLFFSIKSILKLVEDEIDIEQLSFILGKSMVISFQEKAGDHFEHIRGRIREKLGLVRSKKADFLLYLLLDAILDNYFETFDSISEDIAELEKETLNYPKQQTLLKIETKRKAVAIIKKSLVPMREALSTILNDRTSFIDESNMKYYRDLKNSCSNAIEEFEGLNQTLEGLTNIYFSSISHKMNEIVKVLTLVSTIFIPLTFIAGIYGMNFEYMPELHYKNGYFIVWGVMGFVVIGMLIFFSRKRWF